MLICFRYYQLYKDSAGPLSKQVILSEAPIVLSILPRYPCLFFPSSQMPDQQQTLSVPSLLLLAAFAAVTIRYFFFTKPSTSSPQPHPRAANPADVEQIATMFPQIARRDIIWDLQRNGGSVNATTERILGRGSLDTVGNSKSVRARAMGFLGYSTC